MKPRLVFFLFFLFFFILHLNFNFKIMLAFLFFFFVEIVKKYETNVEGLTLCANLKGMVCLESFWLLVSYFESD